MNGKRRKEVNMDNIREKGYVIVVTYNRKEKLEKCIDCLLNQTYSISKILIIDNASTDGTDIFLKQISKQYPSIFYYRNKENEGGAGGFDKGIRLAYEEGADWIWGMDDDAFPEKNALYNLLSCRSENSLKDAYWSNPNNDMDFEKSIKYVNSWMFVGFFLTREIVQSIGFPRKDFFIYYDDYEYADRIIANGFNIWKVKDSVIKHQDAASNKRCIYLGNIKKEVILLPEQKWKTYYLVRNDLLRHAQKDRRYYQTIFRNIRRIIKAILFCPNQLGIVIKGFYHGLTGKSGKRVLP